MKHVALIGKARAGKDSVARILQEHAGYTRLAFADKLKEAALRVNPLVQTDPDFHSGGVERLADLVRDGGGWEVAKESDDVRRFLQNYGQTVREMDPKFWVRPVVTQILNGTAWNMPAVVTDVRYMNEVRALRDLGAVVVRVERQGAGLAGDAAKHSSETELDDVQPDAVIRNSSNLADLERAVRASLIPNLSGD